MWPISSRGGKALVAGPLKKDFFCGLTLAFTEIKAKNTQSPINNDAD